MRAAQDLGALADVLTETDDLAATEDGSLAIGGVALRPLIDRFGSPLYVVSEQTLRANYRRIRDAFSRRWPEEATVLYAIKANNNLAIRAVMHSEGAGGDCFGEGELHATLAGGADPRTLVMNGTSKSDADLERAVELGIFINIDAEDEIPRLELIAARLKRPAHVNLRLKLFPEALDKAEWDYVGAKAAPLSAAFADSQYGYSLAAAEHLVPRIRSTPGLILHGYHLHLGRASRDLNFYRAWAIAFAQAIITLREATQFEPSLIDIGGGYPRQRDPESKRLDLNAHSIDDYADAVLTPLLTTIQAEGCRIPRLWLEPGRYIVGNAVVLVGTVGSVKHDLGKTWVNVDMSVNNLMRIETRGSQYHILAAERMREPHDQVVHIVGPLCTGASLGVARSMPPLARGDLIAILDAGMYAETASTQLNGVPRPATVLVGGESIDLIKERESVLDVFGKHRIPPRLMARESTHARPMQP